MNTQQKACTRCGLTKPTGEFRPAKQGALGVASWCRECARAYDRERNVSRRATRRIGRPPKQVIDGQLVCGTCAVLKPTAEFAKDSTVPTGFRSRCKACDSVAAKVYHQKNRETRIAKARAWNQANPERHRALKRESDARCRPRVRQNYKDWKNANPSNRLSVQLRVRISTAVRRQIERQKSGRLRKAGSAVRDLGCMIEELMVHLERQFQPGMTWNNYGEWHIDHVKPLASFDLTDRVQFLAACHFTNLQPLWGPDNIARGARSL